VCIRVILKVAGLPLGSVRNYEQGLREPYWTVVYRLAEALGTDCRAFADCVDGKPAPRKTARKKP
jgi:hypothetical protein